MASAASQARPEPALRDLFLDWLGMPEGTAAVEAVLAEVAAQSASPAAASSPSPSPAAPPSAGLSSLQGTPPRSPVKAGGRRRQRTPSSRALGRAPGSDDGGGAAQIGQFYFPRGVPLPPEAVREAVQVMDAVFDGKRTVGFDGLRKLIAEVCGLPSFCCSSLARRVDPDGTGRFSRERFEALWRAELARDDEAGRVFAALRGPDGADHLTRDDLRPLLSDVVDTHPGLEFLDATPEFQFRYVQTVIERVFYSVNRSGNGRLTLGELRRSNFCQTLRLLDEEDDINKVNDYFSYEHFYVIYCKFWELDTDHDFCIDANDLRRYDNFSLSGAIVDRVMSGAARRLTGGAPGRMGYEDFIVFFISEVHKSSRVAIDYWFRCIDLDGDGRISVYEMEPFLEEQRQRLQAFSHEPIRLEDVLCQISDMIDPETDGQFTRRDLRRSGMATALFNILFNISKYMVAEQRDPYVAQQVHDTPQLSDWDRYAISEYYRLAEADEASESAGMEVEEDMGAAGAAMGMGIGGVGGVGGVGGADGGGAHAAAVAIAAAAAKADGGANGAGGGYVAFDAGRGAMDDSWLLAEDEDDDDDEEEDDDDEDDGDDDDDDQI